MLPAGDFEWIPHELVRLEGTGVERLDEQMGTKEKDWVTDKNGEVWLFKYVRTPGDLVMGEDWAEWLVDRLGRCLGVPTAEVHPAADGGRRALISRNFAVRDRNERLVHGNELLVGSNPDYDTQRKRENPHYTLESVHRALASAGPPKGIVAPVELNGFGVWAGYLLMDAWVAGQDRHHENWGVIVSPAGRRLAPSFDHGNALGFSEPTARLEQMSSDRNALSAWANKGRSQHFAGRRVLTDLAYRALEMAGKTAKRYWLGRLESVQEDDVARLCAAPPDTIMDRHAKEFVVELLAYNRTRILNGN